MNTAQLANILTSIQTLPENGELTAAILKMAADSATLNLGKMISADPEIEKEMERIYALPISNNKKTVSTVIKFTQKEIDIMSKTFKKEFIANGMAARIIKRPSGRDGYYYEIRYRRNGYNITVSSTDLKMAKQLFIETTKHLESPEQKAKSRYKFDVIIGEWLKYKHGKVAEDTWKGYESLIRRFIPDNLRAKPITDVHTSDIDTIMKSLETPRLYEDMRTIFNSIFKYAKASGIITYNPVEMIPFKRAERENRDRISDEQLVAFLLNLEDPYYDKIRNYAYAMYFFGLRPCEIDEEARFDNGFLVCRNRKRKNGKKAYKKIPIPREALKFFDFNKPLTSPLSYDRTLDIIKRALGDGCVPYQLRHTFASICDEKVKRELVEVWMGDSPERLVGKTYVHFSDKFMQEEMAKVKFIIP